MRGSTPDEKLTKVLDEEQLRRLDAYAHLLIEANRRVNLVSRRTTLDDVRLFHIRHALTLLLFRFPSGSRVVDFGTGGGLPGIPLAICEPDITVVLLDSIRKKIESVEKIVSDLGLENVEVVRERAESWTGSVDYAVSRATASLADLWGWTRGVVRHSLRDKEAWRSGLLAMKGGDLTAEIAELERSYPHLLLTRVDLRHETGSELFEDKCILNVSVPAD